MRPFRLWCGNCLELLPKIDDQSVDLIYCDLPYGTTNNHWDAIISFELMWKRVGRIIKPGKPIIFHAAEPFTSTLICSKLDWFRYRWTWNKVNRITGFLDAKRRPMRVVEDVVVFSTKGHPKPYHPQMTEGKPYEIGSEGRHTENYGQYNSVVSVNYGQRYPTDLLNIGCASNSKGTTHSTPKPVHLAEYFLKTYSDVNSMVCDFTMGSGTAGIASARLQRNFIGIEKDPDIFADAEKRIRVAEKTGLIVGKINKVKNGFF